MSDFRLNPIPNFGRLLQRHFFAGLLVLIPLAVIFWILGAALGSLWQLQSFLPEAWNPSQLDLDPRFVTLIQVAITVGLALFLALGVSFLGWVSKQYLGRKTLEILADLIQRIPVVRSIYSALDQLLKTMAAGGSQQFNRVVYVEYPRKGCWALAFVTGPARGPAAPVAHLNVYVPTTPNPTSGFHLIVPENEVRESLMSVEDAFKTILSLGIAQPSGITAPGGPADG